MKAITLKGKEASVTSIPPPELRPTHLVVKIEAVALNPTDWKHIFNGMGGEPFSIVGCDFAGSVVSVGPQVTKSFRAGEKVFGCVHGSNASQPYDGVFAEYAAVKGDLTMRVPSSTSLENAATIPLGSITVGQGLFQKGKGIGLQLPGEGKPTGEWVLVYGGSTATGTLGIQFAKLAGYKVITTCSSKNFDLVKSRGADEVFDYTDPDVGSKIRKITGDKLKYAWDTVSEEKTAKICAEALSSSGEGAHYGTILNVKAPREDVKFTTTLMYTVFGEEFTKGGHPFPASKEDFEFGKVWFALTEKLVGEGKLKAHPASVRDGGLEGILKGLDDLKEGRVHGEKLVYRISQ